MDLFKNEKRRVWTPEETLALLEAYGNKKYELLKHKNKKIVLEQVHEDLSNKGVFTQPTTLEALQGKLKSLLRAYKAAILEAAKNDGYACKKIPFQKQIEQIFGKPSLSSNSDTTAFIDAAPFGYNELTISDIKSEAEEEHSLASHDTENNSFSDESFLANNFNHDSKAILSFAQTTHSKRFQDDNTGINGESMEKKRKTEEVDLKIDPDHNFLISCLPHLKSLSSMNNMRFRMEVTKLLFDLKQSENDAGHSQRSSTLVSSTEKRET